MVLLGAQGEGLRCCCRSGGAAGSGHELRLQLLGGRGFAHTEGREREHGPGLVTTLLPDTIIARLPRPQLRLDLPAAEVQRTVEAAPLRWALADDQLGAAELPLAELRDALALGLRVFHGALGAVVQVIDERCRRRNCLESPDDLPHRLPANPQPVLAPEPRRDHLEVVAPLRQAGEYLGV